jgi:hypothetical protein
MGRRFSSIKIKQFKKTETHTGIEIKREKQWGGKKGMVTRVFR